MLTFFRRIRKSLLGSGHARKPALSPVPIGTEGKVERYLLYAFRACIGSNRIYTSIFESIGNWSIVLCFSLFSTLIAYVGCSEASSSKSKEYSINESMARAMCSSCHMYTPPEVLDRISWPQVMKVMRNEMEKQGVPFIYEDWISVQQFYLNHSPPAFHSTKTADPPKEQTLYRTLDLPHLQKIAPNLTMVKYIEENNTLYCGLADGLIYLINQNYIVDSFRISNITVDIETSNSGHTILGMGSLGPTDVPSGQLIHVDSDNFTQVVVDSLIRPIHFSISDFDKDSQEEFIISSFGSTTGHKNTGQISIHEKTLNGTHTVFIDSIAGAMKSIVIDIDKDGQEEIVALFSQGNESVRIYHNDGTMNFKADIILNFLPVYGTNDMAIHDFDNDGELDILVTHGDNDDYSQVFKSYHGVSIFRNLGGLEFEEMYTFHLNGASKVIGDDLDNDGDTDFVIVAMYPDLFSRPYETHVLFKNQGNFKFIPQYFENIPSSHWVFLESGDMDKDGMKELIIGGNNQMFGQVPISQLQEWNKKAVGIKIYHRIQ